MMQERPLVKTITMEAIDRINTQVNELRPIAIEYDGITYLMEAHMLMTTFQGSVYAHEGVY
jgi:hypothetical protein